MEHNNLELKKNIESLLLFKGQPISYGELSKILEAPESDIKTHIESLSLEYKEKGIQIAYSDTECEIVTSPESAPIISKLQKEESESELSNASLETLSIILYMGPIARSMIDFIRGVNSQFTIRNLLIRGLIEKDSSSKIPSYKATLDTIKFLGLNSVTELPNFADVKSELQQFIKENSKDEN